MASEYNSDRTVLILSSHNVSLWFISELNCTRVHTAKDAEVSLSP